MSGSENSHSMDDGVWPADITEAIQGKLVLVGLTTLSAAEEVVDREEIFGRIIEMQQDRGILIALQGKAEGHTYWLPPDLSAFHPAAPGTYTLKTTGEVVIDPDYAASWTLMQPVETEDGANK